MPQLTILSPSDQVVEYLRAELLRGRWKGTMPGVPALAAELEVNHKTVASAIGSLEREGLLVSQGVGRPRCIELPKGQAGRALRVALLVYDSVNQALVIDLRHLLEKAGHIPFVPDQSLCGLGMDVGRVSRWVRRTEADAWVVYAGSREVLQWFAEQETPALALAGSRDGLSIAGAGPDKLSAVTKITRYLIERGHRRICTLCGRQARVPQPSKSVRAFLDELEAAGITTGSFHTPDWEESPEGFEHALDSLFGPTPPTALILDEPHLYYATYHYLARRGLRVPQDVSLVCSDPDPGFAWCQPSVAHMRWDSRLMVRRIVNWANNVALGRDDRRQTLIKVEFVEGGTVGDAPPHSDSHVGR